MSVSADRLPTVAISATDTLLTVRPPLPPSTANASSTCSACVSVSATTASFTVMLLITPVAA